MQGTYETFVEAGRQHYGGDLAGRWILTAGLGGMGGAQPLAASFAGACSLNIECQQSRIDFRLRTRYLDEQARRPRRRARAHRSATRAERQAVSIGLLGNAAEMLPELVRRAQAGGIRPDLVTDQTSAHDLVNGYLPRGLDASSSGRPRRPTRRSTPRCATRPRRAAPTHVQAMLGFQAMGVPTVDYGNNIRQVAFDHGVAERLRLPRLRARLHPAAVLPRQGPVPLGGAVGRPGRHPQDRREDEGAVPATTRTCTAGSTWRGERIAFQGLSNTYWSGGATQNITYCSLNELLRDWR